MHLGALFFTHALVRSSSASDFGFGRREQEGGTIESETYRLEGERKILSSVPLNCECSGCFLEIKTLTVSFFWWNLRRFGALLVCFAAADALLSIALTIIAGSAQWSSMKSDDISSNCQQCYSTSHFTRD